MVAYNSAASLARRLQAVRRQSFDFELILVDNGSCDGAPQRAAEAHPEILLRNRRNLGFAAAVNHPAVRGRGRWLALLNCDAEPERD